MLCLYLLLLLQLLLRHWTKGCSPTLACLLWLGVIHSDRGTQFESEIFNELCSLWRVDKTRTSPYHPQSNGFVERGNRTLGDALRCLLLEQNRRQEDWDELLHHIMRSFRATPNSTTGETANFMMMGRECTLPDTLLYGNEVEPPMSSTDYVALLQSRMQEAHDLLRTQQHTGPIGETETSCIRSGTWCWLTVGKGERE